MLRFSVFAHLQKILALRFVVVAAFVFFSGCGNGEFKWLPSLASLEATTTTESGVSLVEIASGTQYTNTASVTLGLSSQNYQFQMYVTNTAGCASGGAWETYATTRAGWALTQANTTATVYAKFKNSAGDESSCVSDTITHDGISPSVSLTAPVSAEVVRGGSPYAITWTGSDTNPSANPIKIEVSTDSGSTWSTLSASEANDGSYDWAVPSVTSTTYRARVTFTDAAGNASAASSASNFSINSTTPVVAVTSPNGNEIWKGGSTQNITWSSSGLPAGASTAKLEYSLNAGTSWTQIAAGVANIASNTYAWTLPGATNTTQALVRVTVTDAFSVQTADTSNQNFKIDTTLPTLSLSSPVGGESLTGGSTHTITWTGSDANPSDTPISIDVSSDAGSNWSSLATSELNDGSYSWSVPAVTSTTYRIRVSYTDAAGNVKTVASTSNFSINSTTPVVAVTAPNGGEIWKGASTQNITWTSSGLPGGASTAKLEYSVNAGSSWTQIATGVANGASNTYPWTVASVNSTQVRVRVTVTDSFAVQTSDTSNANATIDSTAPTISLTSLTGGQILLGGTSNNVLWSGSDANPGVNPITLEYSSNSGSTWNTLSLTEANDGVYAWTVPFVTSTTYRVRVSFTDAAGHVSTSASSSDFSINSTLPVVDVTAPNGGEIWKGGVSHNITWDSSGLPTGASTAKIEYSSDGGSTWSVITTSTTNASGSNTYSWSVPSINTVSLRVRITVTDSFSVQTVDMSNANATVDSTVPTLTLDNLSGGQIIAGGVSYNILWTGSDTNPGTNPITLEYSANSGTSWNTLSLTEANDGTYSWSVPSVTSTTYRVRVSFTDAAGNVSAVASATDFSINSTNPVVTVTAPNGGDVWKGGVSKNITWTSSGLPAGASTAKLEYSLDGGSSWTQITTGYTNTGSNTYAWSVPASTDSQQARVRVTVTDSFSVQTADSSDANFIIDSTAPSISLLSLTGGQTIAGGVNTSITWSSSDTNLGTTPIKIEYSANSGSTWSDLSATEANDGSYTWTVPAVSLATNRIRITSTDLAGHVTTSASTSDFTINGSSPVVTVTSPNGGEVWKGGASKNITWTSSGLPGGASTAKLEYSLNAGSTWTQITTGYTNTGTNTYPWTVPVSTNTQQFLLRVTVTDSLAVDTPDVSDSNAAIDSTSPTLSLGSLTGGQVITGGSSYNILWTGSDTNPGVNPITLEYSSNSGSTWGTLALAESNDGTYSWSVPSVTSTTYRVRVSFTDAAENTTTVSSTSDFSINSSVPVVAVTSPNGGEYWSGGSTQAITWSASGLPAGASTAKLEYSLDAGSSWSTITNSTTNNAGANTYNWTFPTANTSQALIRVTVTDFFSVQTADVSNANFTIDSTNPTIALTSLTGGQIITGGTSYNITWTASDTNLGTSPIALEVSSNGGSTWSSISASESNDGTYSWSVPSVTSTTYRVRATITDRVGRTLTSTSGTNFSINNTTPVVVVTSPNGGDIWKGGSTQNITWDATWLPSGASTAKIEYSANAGSTWNTIIASTANAAGSNTYSWSVPTINSSSVIVRVTVTDFFSVQTADSSNSNFTIDSTNPLLTLTNLSGGEILTGGSSFDITWTGSDTNPGSTPIAIDLSPNNGSSWTSIVAGEVNDGTYSWSVPSVTGTTYRVRLTFTDAAGNLSTVSSGATFSINSTTPVVAVTSPNGSEYWSGASTQAITWSASGLPAGGSTAKLEYSLDAGSSWSTITNSTTNNAGANTYNWTLPTANSSQARVRVTVTDFFSVQTADVSNSNFTIDSTNPTIALTAPTGSPVFTGGSITSITWTASDTNLGTTPIALELSNDSGSNWTSLSASESNDGTYTWSVPAVTSTTYRVRATITDRVGRTATATSASDFSINSTTPVVAVISPNGGELWSGGSSQNITWNASGLPSGASTAKLEYSTNAGSTWTTIVASTTNAVGANSYTWSSVPSINSSSVIVRVTVTDSFSVQTADSSNANFTIDSTIPALTLTSLTGGQSIASGSDYSITWTGSDANPGTLPITLQYSSNSGANWTTIAFNEVNDGTYTWSVPAVSSTTFRVRVIFADAATNTATATSSSDFSVVPPPPNAATALSWLETAPHSSRTLTAQWTKSNTSPSPSQTITVLENASYSAGVCTGGTVVVNAVDPGGASVQSYAYSGHNGSIYNFKITSTNVNGSVTSVCSAPMQIKALNIEVPIEMADNGLLLSGSTSWLFPGTQIHFNPTAYDGTVSYFFEVVATNTDASAQSAILTDAAGSTSYATISVPASTSVPTRIRVPFTATVDGTYQVKLTGIGNGSLSVFAARIIVRQMGATKTRVYVPLVNRNSKAAVTNTATVLQTALTTASDGTDSGSNPAGIYIVNWSMPTMVAATSTATLDAVLYTSASGGARSANAALYSGATMVPGSQISTTATTAVRMETASFSTVNLGSSSLKIQVWNGGSATTYLSRAGLWITLTGVDSVSTYHRVGKSTTPPFPVTPGTDYYGDNQRVLLNHSGLTPHSFFHEACLSVTGGTLTSSILDSGNATSGTTGSDITGSALATSSPSITCMRSSALSLGDNNYGEHFYIGAGVTAAIPTHKFIVTDYTIAP